jgi:hypothetical protein
MATATKPAPKLDPDLRDWDGIVKRAVRRAHKGVLAETDRLQKLGIIDERGSLIKKPEPSGSKSGNFGGWG